MFSTVFIDISLIFVQLCPENFGKILRPPFYYPRKSTFKRKLNFDPGHYLHQLREIYKVNQNAIQSKIFYTYLFNFLLNLVLELECSAQYCKGLIILILFSNSIL